MKNRDRKLAALAMGAAMLVPTGMVQASSHREAPFITKNPKVDGTDFYMFNSYEANRAGYVTILANYQPLQEPGGGPNYFTMDPEALYEIQIDNTADAVEDLTFQFRFNNTLANGGKGVTLPIGTTSPQDIAIPLTNFGAITASDQSKLNVSEAYSLTLVKGARRTGTATQLFKSGSTTDGTFTKPVDYIGNKTFTNKAGYDAYANQYIYDFDIPGCTPPANTHPRVFVGQRQEGFAVNLGTIFDLVNAPLATVAGGVDRASRGNTDTTNNAVAQGGNTIGRYNITTIALEIPASCLTKTATATGADAIIGGWTTASVRQARVINPNATYAEPSKEGGAWAQVSRLGNPLVNEVVIGIPDKDKWNSSEPKDDTQFVPYVTNPVLPKYLNLLFGAAAGINLEPQVFPRADLLEAFATGIEATDTGTGSTNGQMVNVTKNGATAEYLRLNTALGFTPRGSQSSLGAAACFVNGALVLSNTGGAATGTTKIDNSCDPNGFPNGRRPGDDVTDIELRAALGYLLPSGTDNQGGMVPVTDYAINYDTQFGTAFPYLNTPNPGSN